MAVYNALTGLKRKLSRYETSRKRRATGSSTVASRMYAEQAMAAHEMCMIGCYHCLIMLVLVVGSNFNTVANRRRFGRIILLMSIYYFQLAVHMLTLESNLLDLHNPEDDVGYSLPLQNITLDSYVNDNECESNTRFKKGHIRELLAFLGFPEFIKLHYHPTNPQPYYKFRVEELLLYTLRKMSTNSTHKHMASLVVVPGVGGEDAITLSSCWTIGSIAILDPED